MDQRDVGALQQLHGDLATRPGRLLLLVGQGAEQLAEAVGHAWDAPLTSVGGIFAADNGATATELADLVVAGGSVFIDIDVLFWEPGLQLEVLSLFRRAAHLRPVAVLWPGEIERRQVRYSEAGRPDFYEAELDGVAVLRPTPDVFGDEPSYTMELVGP
jgi:hypothetical protein